MNALWLRFFSRDAAGRADRSLRGFSRLRAVLSLFVDVDRCAALDLAYCLFYGALVDKVGGGVADEDLFEAVVDTEHVRGRGGFSCSQWGTCSGQDPFLFRSGRKRNGSWTPKRKASRGGVPCTPRYRRERDAFYSRPKLRAGRYPDILLYNSSRHRPHIPTLARSAES